MDFMHVNLVNNSWTGTRENSIFKSLKILSIVLSIQIIGNMISIVHVSTIKMMYIVLVIGHIPSSATKSFDFDDYVKMYVLMHKSFDNNGIHQKFTKLHTLVKISQNVTASFATTCDLYSFVTKFESITTMRSNFNYFHHSYNYDATIKNFILSVGCLLSLFSSIIIYWYIFQFLKTNFEFEFFF